MENLSVRCNVFLSAESLSFDTYSSCNMSRGYSCTDSEIVAIPLPDFRDGTLPIADVFWYCSGDRARQTLPAEWQGCCAPVRLDGKTCVLLLPENPPLKPSTSRSYAKRDTALWTQYILDANSMNYSDWAADETVHLDFGKPARSGLRPVSLRSLSWDFTLKGNR